MSKECMRQMRLRGCTRMNENADLSHACLHGGSVDLYSRPNEALEYACSHSTSPDNGTIASVGLGAVVQEACKSSGMPGQEMST